MPQRFPPSSSHIGEQPCMNDTSPRVRSIDSLHPGYHFNVAT
ncbi:hypothetical protein RISK_004067 [Rhodopirellula islandica]|uniref:Uncharacterized protein n=1 Tax=Rhodopirellula islandica TaxID=595434 RepID=A0A0J1BAB2_RHOIS|nr:hypothetical protein RISK_004067 [Rhodopirellula islandica]